MGEGSSDGGSHMHEEIHLFGREIERNLSVLKFFQTPKQLSLTAATSALKGREGAEVKRFETMPVV